MKLCWRRRSSGASSKLRVSRVRRKHESALKTTSIAKERNMRLRGTGCARELVALGNLERQDSGRECIPVARSRCGVVPPTVFNSLRHVRFSFGTLTFPVHAIVKCVSILRSFFTHGLDPCCLVRKTKVQFTGMASNLHFNFVIV